MYILTYLDNLKLRDIITEFDKTDFRYRFLMVCVGVCKILYRVTCLCDVSKCLWVRRIYNMLVYIREDKIQ